MEVIYHPRIRAEVLETLRYYTGISPRLADDFHDELKSIIATVAENPLRFHLRSAARNLDLHPQDFVEVETQRTGRTGAQPAGQQ